MSDSPSDIDVQDAIIDSLRQLYEHDIHLIKNDANERSITHRLAVYLEQHSLFHGWHIDCEYNRNQSDIKRLRRCSTAKVPTDDLNAQTVYPDIIVHRRGTHNNLLVIEAKKSDAESSDKDIEKLRRFQQQENLGYEYAYAVRFGEDCPELIQVCSTEKLEIKKIELLKDLFCNTTQMLPEEQHNLFETL